MEASFPTSITYSTFGTSNQTDTTTDTTTLPEEKTINCFIDPQLAFIVVSATGSLIIVLLISVFVLGYKVFILKRRCQARSPNHNMASRASGHWSDEQAGEGIVGPCETNLLLEEVRADAEDAAVEDEEEEVEAMLHQSNTKNKGEENVLVTMQTSTSRDSCIDPAKELEDMPLVV